jgi:ankyrin repeat protein
MDFSDKFTLIITIAPILLIPLSKWIMKKQTGVPLFNAVIQGDTDAVKKLVAKHMFVDVKDVLDMTPLMYASIEGHTDIVRLLVGRGANVSMQSVTGMTALTYAKANGHDDIVRILVDAGAIE